MLPKPTFVSRGSPSFWSSTTWATSTSGFTKDLKRFQALHSFPDLFPCKPFPLLPHRSPTAYPDPAPLVSVSLLILNAHFAAEGLEILMLPEQSLFSSSLFLHIPLCGEAFWCFREPGLPAQLLSQCSLRCLGPDPAMSPDRERASVSASSGAALISLCLHLSSSSTVKKEDNSPGVWISTSFRQT